MEKYLKEFDSAFNWADKVKNDELFRWKIMYGFVPKDIRQFLLSSLQSYGKEVLEAERKTQINENTSDGYHTFKELYQFRKIYNAVLFNEWAVQGKYSVHKSKKHSDGQECFGGGWFIVTAQLPTGQISNHYELKDWDLFKVEERELSDTFDGHTALDVIERLATLDIINEK